MAESRLIPDPYWLAEFEALSPGDPRNVEAAQGIYHLKSLWPGGEAEALRHLDRVFNDATYEVAQATLERACEDSSRTPAEIREIAGRLEEIRTLRRNAA